MSVHAGNVTIGLNFDSTAAARSLRTAMGEAGAAGAAAAGGAAQTRLDMLATKMASAGRNMFYSFTLPLLGIGKKAADAFLPFEKALTNIEGLVGVDKATVQAWGAQIREIGPQFGVMADDAARAMYFITSSGIDASDAMMVLKAAMTGAQAGLGSTEVVADLVTTALNAYGLSADHATQITDQLTVAVKRGKAEPEELAQAVGRVVPIAAQMGVTFDQVVGSLAAMTLSGSKADEAATQLSQVMNTLLDPSTQAKQALAQVGITAEGLRATISKDGLQAGLTELSDAFGGNTSAMAQVFGNIRALRGMFNLTGKNAKETADILREVAHAEGETARAAQITANSVGGKLNKSLAELNSQLIDVGAVVVPFFEKLVGGATAAASGFGLLGPAAQTAVVALAGLAAAGGPLLLVGSSIVRGWGLGSAAATKFGNAMWTLLSVVSAEGWAGGLRTIWGGLKSISPTVGIAAAAVALWGLKQAWDQFSESASSTGDALRSQIAAHGEAIGGGAAGLANQIANAGRVAKGLQTIADTDWNPLARKAATDEGAKTKAFEDRLKNLQKNAAGLATQFNITADAATDFLQAQDAKGIDVSTPEKAADAWRKYAGSQDVAADKARKTASALGALRSAAEAGMGAFVGVVDAQRNADASTRSLADAEDNLRQAQEKRQRLQAEGSAFDRGDVAHSERLAEARKRVTDAERQYTGAVRTATEARQKLQALESGVSIDEKLSVESAQLGLDEAIASQRTLASDSTALDRRRADLSVRQARRGLEQAKAAHGEAIDTARKELEDAQAQVDSAIEARDKALSEQQQAKVQLETDLAAAVKDERDAAWGVEDARWAQFKAYDALVPAQATFNALLGTENEEHGKVVAYIDTIKARYPEMASAAEAAYGRIGIARRNAEGTAPADARVAEGQTALSEEKAQHRAFGGPLAAGQLSTITERGLPEVFEDDRGTRYFIPATGGMVIPLSSSAFEGVSGTANGGDTYHETYNIVTSSPEETPDEIRRQRRKRSFLAGGR